MIYNTFTDPHTLINHHHHTYCWNGETWWPTSIIPILIIYHHKYVQPCFAFPPRKNLVSPYTPPHPLISTGTPQQVYVY